MKIQINAMGNDGVWGWNVSVWDGDTCVAQQWFATMPALPSSVEPKGGE